ncbi:cytochrome P460 family protein [Pseudomonas agarici]|uniref:cytochrome P460 family protein n=2 Tax=Pseudomonas agarici TaxID=46677 RepID=UPI0008CE31EF|nr:cytochrome P460 family protein [Pseudomonas agarici]NWB93012.1 cytochrome P460 family protein [Pseudomonas agarici]NWC09279.1 cytochrome P460 family protein [Pseudomonas agarici]SEK29604.1 Cytochrome P460 [Pseudomonas agarici]
MIANKIRVVTVLTALLVSTLPAISLAESMAKPSNIHSTTYSQTYKNYVDKNGNIKVPKDYRTEFVFLGSFAVPGGDSLGGLKQLHQVYVDRDSIEYYRSHGDFPDGAMLIKELQGTTAADLTTGHASFWNQGEGWFVMIKDTKGRYKDSGIWTDGWGWALIAQEAPSVTTNKDTSTCIACHTPVKKTDWVHVWAYPLLNAHDKISTLNN